MNFGIDATVPEAADALVRPTYRGVKQAGFTYVKIDSLRHLLYDSLHSAPNYARSKGLTSGDIFRSYLATARQELGPDVFVLSCGGYCPR